MRVLDLSKELGVPSKTLLDKLASLGIEAKSHFKGIEPDVVDRLRSLVNAEKAGAPVKAESHPAAAPAPVAKPGPQAKAPAKPPAAAKPLPSPAKAATPPAPGPQAKAPSKTPAAAKPLPSPAKAAMPPPPAAPAPRLPEAREAAVPPPARKVLLVKGPVVVRELAEQLGMRPNQLIAELMAMNVFASINMRLDLKVAQQVAEKHGFAFEHEKKAVDQKMPAKKMEEDEPEERAEDLKPRAPIVTFMGHIDHGKTLLLDKIRNSSVAAGESGGITQHIGAYTVERDGKQITFLDTPGHKAFTAMRARGANLTDIAVIVIAADDGIMPQTEEAIKHAQAAETTIMVAINKMDLPTANPDQVKRQLQAAGLAPEDWGGTIVCCPVSAMTGQGIDHLLEMILLQAEMQELKANDNRRGHGFVIESRLEPGMGPTATLMVMNGTLRLGDMILCGPHCGRVKALINDRGQKMRSAGPATPVKCLGLSGVPDAGEEFRVTANDRAARDLAELRAEELKARHVIAPRRVSLDDLMVTTQDRDNRRELKAILKCDTHGSLEAIQRELGDIKSDKVAFTLLYSAVGNITENDVLLASASDAIIIGFNVAKEPGVASVEKREGIEIRLYSIIYDIVEQLHAIMSGLLSPELRERLVGSAEVRQLFPLSKKGFVAGCMVKSGRIHMGCKVRVRRGNAVVFEGNALTIKHFQDVVNEMREGQECGIRMANFGEFETGDVLDFIEIEKIPQKL